MPISSLHEIRILHVDDEPDFADLTGTFLEREDDRFAVETATSADEGLRLISDRPPDCVVSDYNMPGMDGLEFLQAVRKEYPGLPFILFTGKGSEAVASDAISAGVTDYLQKCSGTEQYELLANRIETAVSQYRAERQLERQNDLFAKAQDMANVGVWEYNIVSDSAHLSEEAMRIHGLSPDETLTPETSIEYYHPDDRERIRQAFTRAVRDAEAYDLTARLVTEGGTQRWVRTRGEPQSENGEIVRVRGTIQDITESKEREQELERYANIVEASGDPVYTLDEKGRFTFVNDALVEMTGYKETDLLGQHFCSILVREDTERGGMVTQSLREPDIGRRTTELRVVRPDGSQVPCEIKVTPLPYERDFRGTVGVIRDITERTEREEQLRKQRQRLTRREEKLIRLRDYTQELTYTESPAEAAAIALHAVDDILGFNLGAVFSPAETQDGVLETVEVLNRSRMEKMYGGLPAFLRDAPSGTHSALAWDVFTSGESVFINDTTESETLTWKSPFGSLMMYPLGRHGIVLLAATQLDAFTETEEILLDLLATALETSFDRLEREDDLRRQRDELQRQNERLDQFVSVIAHDLRNPLNVASSRLELASEECESTHLADAAGALDRMATLIDDVLTIAREGKPVQETEIIALSEIAEDCWSVVETGEATLRTNGEQSIRADPGRLRQLLENLVGNAIDHGKDDVTVTVGRMADGFYVADDGTGIPAEEREEVFEAGYSTADSGTGLGLNIVKEIVEAHGWEISVIDSDDGGARFEIVEVETS